MASGIKAANTQATAGRILRNAGTLRICGATFAASSNPAFCSADSVCHMLHVHTWLQISGRDTAQVNPVAAG